jgi:hypothetical protein
MNDDVDHEPMISASQVQTPASSSSSTQAEINPNFFHEQLSLDIYDVTLSQVSTTPAIVNCLTVDELEDLAIEEKQTQDLQLGYSKQQKKAISINELPLHLRLLCFPEPSLSNTFQPFVDILNNTSLHLSSFTKLRTSVVEADAVEVMEVQFGEEEELQLGLKAKRDIDKKAIIAYYQSEIVDAKSNTINSHKVVPHHRLFAFDGLKLANDWKEKYKCDRMDIERGFYKHSDRRMRCYPSYAACLINASTQPNAKFIWISVNKERTLDVPFVVATRDIPKGQEITIDYRIDIPDIEV